MRMQRRARQEHTTYDAIWCVFDRDQHECFERAIDSCRHGGWRVAPSVPSFEIWILLHLHFKTAPFTTSDKAVEALEKHIPGYDEVNVDWARLLPLRKTAKQGARRILEQDTSGTPYPNPSTCVHELVELLENPWMLRAQNGQRESYFEDAAALQEQAARAGAAPGLLARQRLGVNGCGHGPGRTRAQALRDREPARAACSPMRRRSRAGPDACPVERPPRRSPCRPRTWTPWRARSWIRPSRT